MQLPGLAIIQRQCRRSQQSEEGSKKYPFLKSVYHFWPSAQIAEGLWFLFRPLWWPLWVGVNVRARLLFKLLFHLWGGPGWERSSRRLAGLAGLMNYYTRQHQRTPLSWIIPVTRSFVAKIIKWPGMNDLMTLPMDNCRSAEKGSSSSIKKGVDP